MEEYKLINEISFQQPAFLTTDNLGNAYVVVENQLMKFDPEGNPLANFSETNFGKLQFVDAANPLRVLLFYPDFARLIFLDNKLAIQSSFNLRLMNINQPVVVCNSTETGYWIYDREDDQLKKFDSNQQLIQQSGSILQHVGYQVNPNMMAEGGGFIYMNNPASGILVFDRFGTYYMTIPIKDVEALQVVEKEILFISNKKYKKYDFKSHTESEVLLPEMESLRSARIEQHQLYLLTNASLKFYSF